VSVPVCARASSAFILCFIILYRFPVYILGFRPHKWERRRADALIRMAATKPNLICCSCIISRRMRWAGHVALMGEERGVCRVLLRKPEGRRPLGRPRRRWVDNIMMDLQEVGCGYMDWIGLAQDRQVADACECGNEHSGSMKCGEFLD